MRYQTQKPSVSKLLRRDSEASSRYQPKKVFYVSRRKGNVRESVAQLGGSQLAQVLQNDYDANFASNLLNQSIQSSNYAQ